MGELFFQSRTCIELCTEFHPVETCSSVSAQTASHCRHSSLTVYCGSNPTSSHFTPAVVIYTQAGERWCRSFKEHQQKFLTLTPRSDPEVSPWTTCSCVGVEEPHFCPVVVETSCVLWLSRLCPTLNSEGVENPALMQSWARPAEFQSLLWHTAGHRWKSQELVGTAVYTPSNECTIVFHLFPLAFWLSQPFALIFSLIAVSFPLALDRCLGDAQETFGELLITAADVDSADLDKPVWVTCWWWGL